jgi:hypothetical protein
VKTPSNFAVRSTIVGFLVCLAWLCTGLVFAPAPAHARPGWFVGGGLARVTASGNLNSNAVFENADGTELIAAGGLQPGGGIVFDGGYGFNKYVAAEFMFVSSRHNATMPAVFPSSTATVTTDFLAVRGTYPLTDALEGFVRFGFSGHVVTYSNGSLTGNVSGVFTQSGPVTFGGSGIGLGVGAEYFIGHVGLGAGYTTYLARFNSATGQTQSGGLSETIAETISVLDFTALYHF